MFQEFGTVYINSGLQLTQWYRPVIALNRHSILWLNTELMNKIV
jgi:hypothetical protein